MHHNPCITITAQYVMNQEQAGSKKHLRAKVCMPSACIAVGRGRLVQGSGVCIFRSIEDATPQQ